MESPKARLSEVGAAIQQALAAETDAANDLRVARAQLLHEVTHAPARPARSFFELLFTPRVVATFLLPIAAASAWLFWLSRPISFAVGSDGAPGRIGDVVEANARVALPLAFSEGSSFTLTQGSRARVLTADESGARVLLENGDAEVSIQHRVGQKTRWFVEAGPFSVRVTGTRFRVAWQPAENAFDIRVHEGSVVVSSGCAASPSAEHRVKAGEHYALRCQPKSEPVAPSVEAPAAEVVATEAHTAEPQRDPSNAPAAALSPPLDGFQAPLAEGRWADAVAAAERAGLARVANHANQSELLQLADAARLSGHADRAALLLDTLRKRFPGSNEAATAAFSLGRSAFDQRHAYAEAARWFSAYLDERPNGPLMGDAFGRLLEAHEQSGDHAAARAVAERYLRRFPQGPYAPSAKRILAE